MAFKRQDIGRQREQLIHSARDLVLRIESNPASALQLADMDGWERWLLEYGMPLVAAGLDEWEVAALECIVRHTPESSRIPQQWLFEGGPSGDNQKLLFPFLSENYRKVKLTRLIKKMHKLGGQFGLRFKVERAVDCSKTIYTATTSIYSLPLPQQRNDR